MAIRPTWFLVGMFACGHGAEPQDRESSRVEVAIERELSTRVQLPLRVRCAWLPPSCRARLPDGEILHVVIDARGEWRIDGAIVLADDLEQYLRDALADLGTPQTARCGARIRSVAVGDRVECALQNGGRAFVVVNADGRTSIEIELDRAAVEARTQVMRDDVLLEMSRKLAGDEGEEE